MEGFGSSNSGYGKKEITVRSIKLIIWKKGRNRVRCSMIRVSRKGWCLIKKITVVLIKISRSLSLPFITCVRKIFRDWWWITRRRVGSIRRSERWRRNSGRNKCLLKKWRGIITKIKKRLEKENQEQVRKNMLTKDIIIRWRKVFREWKASFMKNNITRDRNHVSMKIKHFITLVSLRISKKNTKRCARRKLMMIFKQCSSKHSSDTILDDMKMVNRKWKREDEDREVCYENVKKCIIQLKL